jgi:hypothetical protein
MIGFGSNNSRGIYDNIAVQVLPPEITFEGTEEYPDTDPAIGFLPVSGDWQTIYDGVGNHYSEGVPDTGGDRAINLIDLADQAQGLQTTSVLQLEATLNTQSTAGFVFDCYSLNDFKFAGIDAVNDRLVIGHHTATGGWAVDAAFDIAIEAGRDYLVSLSLKGTSVSLYLKDQPDSLEVLAMAGYVFNAVTVDGNFGLITRDGSGSFDAVTVKTNDPAFLPETTTALFAATTPQAFAAVPAALSGVDLDPVLDAAVRRFGAEGLMDGFDVQIADLPGLALGRTEGNAILIDVDAAGHGWFIDPTPDDDGEFRRFDGSVMEATNASPAAGRIDLLTAVMHELGHIVGLDHTEEGLMADSLATGARLLPAGMIGPAAVAAKVDEAARRAARDVRIFLEEQDALLRRDEARFLAWMETRHDGFVLDTSDDEDDEDEAGVGLVADEDALGLLLDDATELTTGGSHGDGGGDVEGIESGLESGISSGLEVNWEGRFSGFLQGS